MNHQNFRHTDARYRRTHPLLRHLAATFLSGVSLIAAAEPAGAGTANGDPSTQFEGSWKIWTEPPVTFIPPHLALSSFAPGGVVISSPIIYLPPPFVSMGAGYGTWQQTKGKEFSSTFVAFGYDSSGQAAGTLKVNATYRLTDKNSFEGKSELLICNLRLECGPPLPGLATIHGTRIPVEPLSNP